MSQSIKSILSPLASLKLTVVLLLLSMALIFAGTTIQAEMGIWEVQRQYFHSWFKMVDVRLFFPLWDWGVKNIPGAIPFPGGYTLIVLLLLNLLAAHSVRFKMTWKRSGIVLIHAGLILLIVGEVVTAESAREGNMVIDTGSSANFIQDTREVELAITDPSPAEHDKEIVIPIGRLVQAGTIQHPELPFTLSIDKFYSNTDISGGPMQPNAPGDALATIGTGRGLKIIQVPNATGTESSVDMPSAFVTLKGQDGSSMGTMLLTTMELNPQFSPNPIHLPQIVEVGGKEYWLHLRFRRTYKPYTLHLIEFSHDRYLGTNVPMNYSSLVRLVDPANNVDREVLIWMNHPLRYAGETFYQSSFKQGDQTTILQVVNNPGWLIPYISCTMVSLGMLVHFGILLLKFLKTVNLPAVSLQAVGEGGPRSGSFEPVPAGAKRNGKHKGATAVKERPVVVKPSPLAAGSMTRASRVPAMVATSIALLYLVGSLAPRGFKSSFDLDAFSRLPITHDGRTMPMDSLARNSLRIMSGRSQLAIGEEKRPAIVWLLDVFADPERAATYDVFRIDDPDIKSLLGLPDLDVKGAYRKYYSFDDIAADRAKWQKLAQQFQLADRVPQNQRDRYQRNLIELVRHVLLWDRLAAKHDLFLSPPLDGREWRTLAEAAADSQAGRPDPGAAAFVAMTQAKAQGMSAEFAGAASAYRGLLDQRLPELTRKLDIEVLFNRAQPFITCMALYVLAFLLAAISWMKWHGPLAKAALWVLIVTAIFHTLGLVARIYIQGRPPITNLYSTAIFIAWFAVAFCIVLEFIFRNGVATAAASAIAFPSLLIAHYLAGSGDTMQMLQAVLDTNIWLATHVVIINIGYSATFLAGFLGIIYVLGAAFTDQLTADARKTLYRMVYGVVCFAILFSFVGTVLGGIWADQSWGRFWGWDPKENGAVLLVFWNAVCLHARWGGLVRERGFMLLAILGNIVTAWSWFGTNMLGVGLHSYGFMDSAEYWLFTFYATQVAIIVVGLLPAVNERGLRDTRGFPVRPV